MIRATHTVVFLISYRKGYKSSNEEIMNDRKQMEISEEEYVLNKQKEKIY